MVELGTKAGLATQLREYLEEQNALGFKWVVYDSDNPVFSKFDLSCFVDSTAAFAFEREYQQIFNWHQSIPISDMIYQLKKLEKLGLPQIRN